MGGGKRREKITDILYKVVFDEHAKRNQELKSTGCSYDFGFIQPKFSINTSYMFKLARSGFLRQAYNAIVKIRQLPHENFVTKQD